MRTVVALVIVLVLPLVAFGSAERLLTRGKGTRSLFLMVCCGLVAMLVGAAVLGSDEISIATVIVGSAWTMTLYGYAVYRASKTWASSRIGS